MKKKIVFFLVDLNLGGIETSFINLINELDLSKLDITVILEHKKGVFIKDLENKNIKIIDYNLNNSKCILKRKIINRLKYFKNIILNKNKYDIAINYCHYSDLFPKLVNHYGKEKILWTHTSFKYLENDENIINYFKNKKFEIYNKIIFVSNEALENYKRLNYSSQELILCRNIINLKKCNVTNKISVPKNKTIFINVSRHDEETKKITRLIEASKILKKKNKNFELWLIGEGKDTDFYKSIVKKYDLEDTIKFLGFIHNPLPYYAKCDAVLMSSNYEGFPVVFCECMSTKKHLITTDVSDAKYIFDETQVTIVSRSPKEFAKKMENIIDKNMPKYNEFNLNKFNKEIKETYKKIFYR